MKTNPFIWHNFVSRLIRLQIKICRAVLGNNTLFPIIPLHWWMIKELWSCGPSFYYKGGEVTWDRRRKRWISTQFNTTINSLKELDAFLMEIEEYESKAN